MAGPQTHTTRWFPMHIKIMKSCGWIAGLTAVAYLAALYMAGADGVDGVEVPADAARTMVALSSTSAILAGGGWIIQGIVRSAAQTEIRRAITNAVAEEMDRHMREFRKATSQVAASTRAASIAEVRQLLMDDVAEIVEAGLKRAERRGMVREAMGRANGATVRALRGEEV